MKINKIKLRNFRNYEDIEISFTDNINIIIGDNAQGKTNLLESIYVLAVTKSFLSMHDKNLIKLNNRYGLISGELSKNGSLFNLDILFNDNGKVVKVNNKEIKKISDYISLMNIVIFSSDSIRIFKDSPSLRRKYFNIQISQIKKKYLKLLGDYNTILRQRNEFLKIINLNKKSDMDYLDIIDDKYIDVSISIFKLRKEYVNKINKYLDGIYKSITFFEDLKLNYISNIDDDKDNIKSKLKNNLTKEIMYKMTMIGPNRDDFNFSLNGKNLTSFGSQGQIRSAVLALKLSEIMIFKEETGDNPILLLDDLFSELDVEKRNNILKNLDNNIQTIITTTDINNINEDVKNKSKIWKIKDGKLFPGK